MLAVTGGKGGTGKTTTTLGLARALETRGWAASEAAGDGSTGDPSVLAVDADWDLPDLGALAGGPRRAESEPEPDTSGDSGPPHPLGSSFEPSSIPGVRVLPAPADTVARDAERTLGQVASAVPSGTTVIADCPAGAGPDAAAPLRVADAALLTTELCAPSLHDAAKAAAMARALGTPVVGAVLTRAWVAPPSLSSLLGCEVLACVPRATGPPLADSPVRAAYGEVADALSGRVGFHGAIAA